MILVAMFDETRYNARNRTKGRAHEADADQGQGDHHGGA